MNWRGEKMRRRFAVLAWALLAFNIPVILWGAYVRVSFSGDGCGAHWPFCNGSVLPQHMAKPMAIEFTHRMMTFVDSVGALVLCASAFLIFPRKHAVRRYASLSLLFLFIEALLGAGLVLFRKVAHDQSAGRAIYLSAHLTNTMLLLGAIALTAWLATYNVSRMRWGSVSWGSVGALIVTIAVSVTGTVAALGDMLFPSSSLAAGMAQDFAASSHFLLRLRLFHPVLAVGGAIYLISVAVRWMRKGDAESYRAGFRVTLAVLLQIAAGLVNFTLLAPIWMQLLHLFLADVLWLAVVAMVLETANIRGRGDSATEPVTRKFAPEGLQLVR